LGAEGLSLLFQQGGEGSFGQASGSSPSDLLHEIEVGVQSRSSVAEGTAGNNFAPAGGEVANFLKEFGWKLTLRHGESCLVLAVETRE
jgi:hypothetical protein